MSDVSGIPESLEDAFPGIATDLDYAQATDSMKELLTQVDLDVEGWRPQPGDKIFGTVKDITDSDEGDFGSYPILTILTPSGKYVNVHAFHTVLRNAVERRYRRGSLKSGTEIAIVYLGVIGEAKGSKSAPEMYRLAVRNQ